MVKEILESTNKYDSTSKLFYSNVESSLAPVPKFSTQKSTYLKWKSLFSATPKMGTEYHTLETA